MFRAGARRPGRNRRFRARSLFYKGAPIGMKLALDLRSRPDRYGPALRFTCRNPIPSCGRALPVNVGVDVLKIVLLPNPLHAPTFGPPSRTLG